MTDVQVKLIVDALEFLGVVITALGGAIVAAIIMHGRRAK